MDSDTRVEADGGPISVPERFEAFYDDGFKLWINGTNVWNQSLPTNEVPYNATATGTERFVAARACLSFEETALWQPPKASSRSKVPPSCIHCQFTFLFI